MNIKIILVALATLSFSTLTSAAGDAAAGKAKAAICAACHGVNGVSAISIFPNLNGQNAAYTVKQLKAFKNKTRIDPSMNAQVSSLTDADIEDLAAFYESLK